jgi:hypothetical protein
MGKEARQEYAAKYTADINYPQLLQIYRRAGAVEPAAVAIGEEARFSFSRS